MGRAGANGKMIGCEGRQWHGDGSECSMLMRDAGNISMRIEIHSMLPGCAQDGKPKRVNTFGVRRDLRRELPAS
jgi:hypothetical protein